MTSTKADSTASPKGWLQALGIYRHPQVAAMLFLGFSAGLPFALVAGTMAAWLMRSGVSMTSVGMFAWVGLLYAFKFAWAPLVDQLRIPFLTGALGRRRSWMLVAQIGVAGAHRSQSDGSRTKKGRVMNLKEMTRTNLVDYVSNQINAFFPDGRDETRPDTLNLVGSRRTTGQHG